jgi:predicted DNA-binding protein
MLAIRLRPELETRLTNHCKRTGVTKTALVSRAIEREIAGAVRHPLEIIEELTAGLKGSGNPRNSQNLSQRLKRKLRAKHHRR